MTNSPASFLSPNTPVVTHTGNNFDAIRILAAALVLYSHHFALTAQMEPAFFGIHTYGGLAVAIFFVISGYLVTASWLRDPHIIRFTLRRVLRIWPALIFVLVATAYGLGAILTSLPLQEYLTHRGTASYLGGIWMRIQYILPGVFENNPYRLGVNGSLWTIPLEVRCYIAIGIAGLLGLLRNRMVLIGIFALYIGWFLWGSTPDVTGKPHYGRELSAFFLMGGALYVLEAHWRRHTLLWWAGTAIAVGALWSLHWRHTALLVGMPFAIIYLGTMATPYLRKAGRWGDPSYGIYLFAFPVQQTIIQFLWPHWGFFPTMLLALAITVALAYVSWHAIEKQFLKLKPSDKRQVSTRPTIPTAPT